MSEVNLKSLFEYLDEFKSEVRDRFDKVEENQRVMQTSIDSLAKMVKDFRDEFRKPNF